MPRIVRAVLGVALGLVALAPVVAAAAGAPTGDDLAACTKQVTIGRDGWARIKAPAYSSTQGAPGITATAVPPGLARRIYVTNGTVIKTSESAGCKWDHIFPDRNILSVPGEVARTVVTQLVAPTDKSLWLATYEDSGGVARPHVAMTRDASYAAGNTTKEPIGYLDDGLPAVGRPVALAVPRRPDSAYLLIEEPYDAESPGVAPARSLYRLTVSNDLEAATGAKRYLWQRVTLPSSLGGVTGIASSPRQNGTIWAWSGRTYAWSRDSGTTWDSGRAPGTVTTVDVDETGVAAVFSAAGDGGLMQRVDGVTGKVRERRATPVRVRSASHGFQSGVYAIAGDRRTYGYDTLARSWVDITPKAGADFATVHFGSDATDRILLGQTPGALFRYDLFPDESFVRRPPGELIDDGPTGGGFGPPRFTPPSQVVTVAPGELAEAPATLAVPPSAGRIDVFFLIDTTSSMTAAIRGLRDGVRQIADEVVSRTRGEACFGVGEVKDFSIADNPHYGAAAITPYKLQQKITCDLDELSIGLEALKEGGGDRYPEEAQTIGLTQAVTGAGHPSPLVPPGQDAGFVAPTRVIVLVTDVGFKMEPEFDGYPTMDETVKVLTSFGHLTHVVGVLLQTHNDLGPALADLREVARRTSTFAPASGADCDGDRRRDVAPGAPLVCKAENYAPSIAPAIVALLLGVKESASLGVQARDEHDVVAGVRDSSGRLVPVKKVTSIANIRQPNTVDFDTVVTCGRDQDGQDLPVRLVGTRREPVVAEASILVRCRSRPVETSVPPPPPPQVAPPPDAPPVLVVPAKPVVLAALVPPIQPPVNNPPPNMNLNAGFSQQEEEQAQLATVSQDAQDGEEADGAELAMSAVDDGAVPLYLGCALMTAAAGAVRVRQRRRTQPALAYATRGRGR